MISFEQKKIQSFFFFPTFKLFEEEWKGRREKYARSLRWGKKKAMVALCVTVYQDMLQ